jgi:hypothetical protein
MVRWKSISFASFLLAILAHFLTLRFPFRDRTMEAVGESQQRAISAENAASTALVEAEADLQALLQRHRPGSPIVDAAVTELANRNDEYANACDASVQADAAVNEQLHQEMLRARHLRRVEHAGRIMAARQPQLEQRGEANVDHVQPAHIGGGEEGRKGFTRANRTTRQT